MLFRSALSLLLLSSFNWLSLQNESELLWWVSDTLRPQVLVQFAVKLHDLGVHKSSGVVLDVTNSSWGSSLHAAHLLQGGAQVEGDLIRNFLWSLWLSLLSGDKERLLCDLLRQLSWSSLDFLSSLFWGSSLLILARLTVLGWHCIVDFWQ